MGSLGFRNHQADMRNLQLPCPGGDREGEMKSQDIYPFQLVTGPLTTAVLVKIKGETWTSYLLGSMRQGIAFPCQTGIRGIQRKQNI